MRIALRSRKDASSRPKSRLSGNRIFNFFYIHFQQYFVKHTPKSTPRPDTFTLFPLLPPELRLKIWREAAADPHTVEMSCTPPSLAHPQGFWFCRSKTPVLFSVHPESREVAMTEYSVLEFSDGQIGVPPRNLHINFAVSTLWLSTDLASEWARDLLEKNEQLKLNLRSLVIRERLWNELDPVEIAPPISLPVTMKWKQAKSVAPDMESLESVRFHS